jgi:riboflavin kinase / FMN adenylyltransferase
MDLPSFSARTMKGRGRGKELGTPTINMELSDIPSDMKEGIYACWAGIDDHWLQGALHYGPRPVFQDGLSCEVYILDTDIESLPERIVIDLIEYLRPVMDFASKEELMAQISDDVARTRDILERHGPPVD